MAIQTIFYLKEIFGLQKHDQGTHLVFGDLFEKSNAFDAIQNGTVSYVSNEFGVTEKLKAVVGLRTELFTSIYSGQNQAGTEIFKDKQSLINWIFSRRLI